MSDEFQENLKLYRNIGKIYFNSYIAVKKMADFDYQIPIVADNELDDISQAVVYTMNFIHEKGFENISQEFNEEIKEKEFVFQAEQ